MSNTKRIFLIEENSIIFNKLNNINILNIDNFNDIDNAIKEIKKIKFIKKQLSFTDLRIIIAPNLYRKLKDKFFYENLDKITVIPKIVIFTEKGEGHFLQNYENDKSNPFFQFCTIKTTIEELKIFIEDDLQSKKFDIMDTVDQLTFDKVDTKEKLSLHLFYKVLIDTTEIKYIDNFTKELYNKYQGNNALKTLFEPIMEAKNIPIELLAKYYIRAYTIESPFYRELNEDLRKTDNKKVSFYLIYIKYLYESIEYKIFSLVKETKLI